jgi:hypothetical protein
MPDKTPVMSSMCSNLEAITETQVIGAANPLKLGISVRAPALQLRPRLVVEIDRFQEHFRIVVDQVGDLGIPAPEFALVQVQIGVAVQVSEEAVIVGVVDRGIKTLVLLEQRICVRQHPCCRLCLENLLACNGVAAGVVGQVLALTHGGGQPDNVLGGGAVIGA